MDQPIPGSPAYFDRFLAALRDLDDDESLDDEPSAAEVEAYAAAHEALTGEDIRPRLAWMTADPDDVQPGPAAATPGISDSVFDRLPVEIREVFTRIEWADAAPWVARDDPEGHLRSTAGDRWLPRARARPALLRRLGEFVREAFAAGGEVCSLRALAFAGVPGQDGGPGGEEASQEFEASDAGHCVLFGLFLDASGCLCASAVDCDLAFPQGRTYRFTLRLACGVDAAVDLPLRSGFAATTLPFPPGVRLADVEEVTWCVIEANPT
jgi:hypothetical protein